VTAKKPTYGSMALTFNEEWFLIGYNEFDTPDWIGTIKFDMDGDGIYDPDYEYVMEFYAFWTGKPFEAPEKGSAFFFGERWIIYDDNGGTLLEGYDEGVTTKNGKYHMTGYVKVATGEFSEWIGRPVYMSGTIGVDEGGNTIAPGIFRLH
jgi:hypothetical protein